MQKKSFQIKYSKFKHDVLLFISTPTNNSGLMIGTDGARALKRHLKYCSKIQEIEILL